MTSSPPCWWTKTKDLSLASFVRPPEVVHFSIAIGVPRGWLKTSYWERRISCANLTAAECQHFVGSGFPKPLEANGFGYLISFY